MANIKTTISAPYLDDDGWDNSKIFDSKEITVEVTDQFTALTVDNNREVRLKGKTLRALIRALESGE